MRDQFRNQMHLWRRTSMLDAVAELLALEGCHCFIMEDVVKRVRITKESLYLHTNASSNLAQEVLALWEMDVMPPTATVTSKLPQTKWQETCAELFEGERRWAGPD